MNSGKALKKILDEINGWQVVPLSAEESLQGEVRKLVTELIRSYEEFLSLIQVGKCAECGETMPLKIEGRPREYCSDTCRQKAHRKKLKGEPELEDHWPSLNDFPDGVDPFPHLPISGKPIEYPVGTDGAVIMSSEPDSGQETYIFERKFIFTREEK